MRRNLMDGRAAEIKFSERSGQNYNFYDKNGTRYRFSDAHAETIV
jgi:hypothetical protein